MGEVWCGKLLEISSVPGLHQAQGMIFGVRGSGGAFDGMTRGEAARP